MGGRIAVEIDLLGPGGSWDVHRLAKEFLRRASIRQEGWMGFEKRDQRRSYSGT